jgi:CRP/FNR family transcriptional regulator
VNTDFAFKLLLFFADELQESERKMRNLAHMSVKGRVALALLALEEKFGTTAEGAINIELSRQDLASYAGATYETLFRILNELQKANAIKFLGKRIAIADRPLLETFTIETNFNPEKTLA